MVAQRETTATEVETPLARVLDLLPGYRSYSRGYTAHCPGPAHRNGDSKPSLMVWENEDGSVGLKCFSGCTRKDICEGVRITESDLYPQSKYKPRKVIRTLDLTDLSLDKCIDPRLLYQCGVIDGHTWHTSRGKEWRNVVRVPYFNLDGSEYSRARIRTDIKASKGSSWEGNGNLIPYGLERLSTNKGDTLILVEGESDCWTLWQWGIPALGIPGATNAQCLQEEHVALFPGKVYIVKEPAAPGQPQAGERFVASLCSRLHILGYSGEVYQLDLQASHSAKDPNDLNKRLFSEGHPQDFAAEWQKALGQAESLGQVDHYLPSVIVTARQYREASQEALAALQDSNRHNPTIFVQQGRLVQIIRDEKKNPSLRQIGVPELRNALTRTADYFKAKAPARKAQDDSDSDEVTLIPISPPKELAEYILAMDPSDWDFPPLVAIVEMPIMRPDGSILDAPGYDPTTYLYYVDSGNMKNCKIPHNPTKKQMADAIALINLCIGEFPYESQADYANMFALLITLVTRYMYKGDVMTALINATKQGTGKSLLALFACILALGRPPAMTSFPEKEEEVKKVIDAKVLSGNTLIVFDNIKRSFESGALDMLTTCRGWYSVRPLGQTKDIAVNVQATVIGTGNNIQLDVDQARRCYQIRLVSPVSNPDERTDITIKDLMEFAIEHRAELVAALLTLARAWYVAGQPAASNKLAQSGSSYRNWCNTVGGILENAGIQGFQENRDLLKAEVNSEEQQISSFLHAWQNEFGNDYIPAVRAVKLIKNAGQAEEDTETHPLFETLPDYLKNALFEREKSVQSCTVVLSKWLAKRVKTPYGSDNIRIEYMEDTHKCQKLWRVAIVPPDNTGGWNGPMQPRLEDLPTEHREDTNSVSTVPDPLPSISEVGSSAPGLSLASTQMQRDIVSTPAPDTENGVTHLQVIDHRGTETETQRDTADTSTYKAGTNGKENGVADLPMVQSNLIEYPGTETKEQHNSESQSTSGKKNGVVHLEAAQSNLLGQSGVETQHNGTNMPDPGNKGKPTENTHSPTTADPSTAKSHPPVSPPDDTGDTWEIEI